MESTQFNTFCQHTRESIVKGDLDTATNRLLQLSARTAELSPHQQMTMLMWQGIVSMAVGDAQSRQKTGWRVFQTQTLSTQSVAAS